MVFAPPGIDGDLSWHPESSEDSSCNRGRCSLTRSLAPTSPSTISALTDDLQDSSKRSISSQAGHLSGTPTRKDAEELPALRLPKLKRRRGHSLTQATVQSNAGKEWRAQPSHSLHDRQSCRRPFPGGMLSCGSGRGDGSPVQASCCDQFVEQIGLVT